MSLSRGCLFVFSSPSGGGKTTLMKALLNQRPECIPSVSYTTRSPREGEVHGKDYHFVDLKEFHRLGEEGEFLETACVHGNWYGTSRRFIEHNLTQGKTILLQIDFQGAAQVRRTYPKDCVSIFILPPSFSELEKRLRMRGTEEDAIVAGRLSTAKKELLHIEQFDYAVVNSEVNQALADINVIMQASSFLAARQKDFYYKCYIEN